MRAIQYNLNGEYAKRFQNRREMKKRKKMEGILPSQPFVSVFFFFNGYSCNFICMYSSISFIVLVAIYSRQHSLCVFFSAFISLCVSVGLLQKKQINLAAPNFFFFFIIIPLLTTHSKRISISRALVYNKTTNSNLVLSPILNSHSPSRANDKEKHEKNY